MRLVIQRVKNAGVLVDQRTVSKINEGLLILCAVAENEQTEDLEWTVNKVLSMRIFSDQAGKMNNSVNDIGGEILVVSQFTLFASTKKGNRPSFGGSAKGESAKKWFDKFCQQLSNKGAIPVQKGIFGADMQVSLTNDGPVTILLDSKDRA